MVLSNQFDGHIQQKVMSHLTLYLKQKQVQLFHRQILYLSTNSLE